MQPADFPGGTVWLVGAGPGDPELLTVKAVRLIEGADIVFYDALVGGSVLDLIPARAERVGVGKRSGRHSKDQATIDALLVAAARAGKRSEEHTSELQSLMRNSYAVFCLKNKNTQAQIHINKHKTP